MAYTNHQNAAAHHLPTTDHRKNVYWTLDTAPAVAAATPAGHYSLLLRWVVPTYVSGSGSDYYSVYCSVILVLRSASRFHSAVSGLHIVIWIALTISGLRVSTPSYFHSPKGFKLHARPANWSMCISSNRSEARGI